MKDKFTAAKAAVKHAWSKVPATARKESVECVLAFVAAFVATASPLLPEVVAVPQFSTVHAVFAASAAAGVRAVYPFVKQAISQVKSKIPAAPTPPSA